MDEQEPVQDDEFVYRRIPRIFFDSAIAPPIRREAFRPTHNDTTGLSVFRAAFLRPEDALAHVDPAKRSDYYVVRLAVADLRALGLTLVANPDPNGPPGHALIPELSWPAYQADKARWKPILFELAKLASAAIVHQPS
ncbi:MAG TPA: hypothetical protein VMF69_05950 [Gemmataceae bacterium]|nr:hypothetical protein [Gemmataceae bacterium]